MLSSLMDNLICALMVNGRALIVGKALDLLQTSRMSIVMEEQTVHFHSLIHYPRS